MLIKTCFLFVFSILAATTSHAEISNINIFSTQYSRETGFQDSVNYTQITIYGATSGNLNTGTCQDATPSSTCSNCDGKTIPCSANRIHANLVLEVTFQSTRRGVVHAYGGPTGRGASISEYQELTITRPTGIQNQGVEGSQNTFSFTVPWIELCRKMGDEDTITEERLRITSCDGVTVKGELLFGIDSATPTTTGGVVTGNGQLDVGVNATTNNDDINTTKLVYIDLRGAGTELAPLSELCTNVSNAGRGACNFSIFPGDQKVFLDGVRTPQTDFTSANYSGVRLFYGTEPTLDSSAPFKDFEMAFNSSASDGVVPLLENTLEGLQNQVPYFFRLATVDIASNIGNLTPPFVGTGTDPSSNGDDDVCYDPTDPNKICHKATPDDVVALFEKEFDCFIATASYGSATEHHVATFRKFRNKILHATRLGRGLIRWYYRNSPPLARFIENNPSWKPIARGALTPLWLFASLALDFPIFLLSLCLLSLAVIIWPRRTAK